VSVSTSRMQTLGLRQSPPDRVALALVACFVLSLRLIPMRIGRAFGLPAHPLLLHIPVVLIPLLSGAAAAVAVRQRWRTHYGAPVATLAVLTLAATILTVGAGQAFLHQRLRGQPLSTGTVRAQPARRSGPRARALRHHAHLGQDTELIMIAFALFVIAMVIVNRVQLRRRRAGAAPGRLLGRTAPLALSAGVLVLAAVSTVWVIRTGHAGASVTWGYPGGASLTGTGPGGRR
jgi:predicted membrane protein DUF2231